MIAKNLHDWVIKDYLLPDENWLSYHFERKLNRVTQRYSFFLVIYVENRQTGVCTNRSILLGSSPRN